MAGSLSDETHDAAQPDKLKTAASTEKCEEKPATTVVEEVEEEEENKSTQGQETLPDSAAVSPPPALTIIPPTKKEDTADTTAEMTAKEPPLKSCRRKLFQPSSKSASSLPARAGIDDLATNSLGRRGRAKSYLTLYNGGGAGGSNDNLLDERGLDGSFGARSELSAPVAGRRRRQRAGDRAYGTLERATSYSSLVATPQRPAFRSANSTRPPPAPPCTTTAHLDFSRHPVHPAFPSAVSSRLPRSGTPGRNNPHPVGLHFQNPFHKDGKTYEVWSPDENIVTNHLPQMCKHKERTNFTGGKMSSYSSDEGSWSPERAAAAVGATAGSTGYQMSYRPPRVMSNYDHRMPTSRFGSTRHRAAPVSMVPNVMSSGYSERRVKLHVPRGQKLESLV